MQQESILQLWVTEQPLKMQTVLCLGTRGPDTHRAPELKKLVRWIRGIIYKPADPDNPSFMFAGLPPAIEEKSPVARELEFVTQHYYAHLMHVLEIIGYRHPDQDIALVARARYLDMVYLFHLHPETPLQLAMRLGPRPWERWPAAEFPGGC